MTPPAASLGDVPVTPPGREVPAAEDLATRENAVPELTPASAQPRDDVFAQSAATLSELDSYRYVTTFGYTGTRGDEPEAASVEVRGEVASADRQTLAWKDHKTGEEFSLVRIGTRAWLREDGDWNEVPEMVAEVLSEGLLVYAPVDGWSLFAQDLESASTFLGAETVNGVTTNHYRSTYGERSAAWGEDVIRVEGEVWIAESGFPVKYQLVATTLDEDGNEGTIYWTMDLSDVNTPIVVEPPQ